MTDNSITGIASFYDQEADRYDAGYADCICRCEDGVVMKYLQPIIQGRVLDFGCGTGLPLRYLAIPDYHGVDVSSQMLVRASKKYPGNHFLVSDMHAMPFRSEAFDTVIGLYGAVSYSLEPCRLLEELYRVLKPNGLLAVMPYTKRVEHNLCLGSYSTATNPDIPKIYYTTKMVQELFAGSGFELISIIGINYFANFVAAMMPTLQLDNAAAVCQRIISAESIITADLPIECARHALVIAKKSALK